MGRPALWLFHIIQTLHTLVDLLCFSHRWCLLNCECNAGQAVKNTGKPHHDHDIDVHDRLLLSFAGDQQGAAVCVLLAVAAVYVIPSHCSVAAIM